MNLKEDIKLKDDLLMKSHWMNLHQELSHTDDVYKQVICRYAYCMNEADNEFYLGLTNSKNCEDLILSVHVPLCKKHFPEQEKPVEISKWPRYFLC